VLCEASHVDDRGVLLQCLCDACMVVCGNIAPGVCGGVESSLETDRGKTHVCVQNQVCHRVMGQCCAHRPSKNKTRFRPRGPLDLMGALACGVVSLYARTVAWGGDAADEVLFHSPIGQSSCALALVLILQLFPSP